MRTRKRKDWIEVTQILTVEQGVEELNRFLDENGLKDTEVTDGEERE